MAFFSGQRVRLTESGISSRGEKYRNWTGTTQCSCAPYTVAWDQGNNSNHEEWELELDIPKTKMVHMCMEKSTHRTKGYYSGVLEFTRKKEPGNEEVVAEYEKECSDPKCVLNRLKHG